MFPENVDNTSVAPAEEFVYNLSFKLLKNSHICIYLLPEMIPVVKFS